MSRIYIINKMKSESQVDNISRCLGIKTRLPAEKVISILNDMVPTEDLLGNVGGEEEGHGRTNYSNNQKNRTKH